MQIQCIPVGDLKANCYIVTKEEKALLIDPGDEPEKIKTSRRFRVSRYITYTCSF